MIENNLYRLTCVLLFPLICFSSCDGQKQAKLLDYNTTNSHIRNAAEDKDSYAKDPETKQIGEYVRDVIQDAKGNLWFGTLAFGLARYDGERLTYFSKKDGLVGNQINSIVEDSEGNLWIATTEGLSIYDGFTFRNYTTEDGLLDNGIWSILEDRTGNIWLGTMKGVCRFDGIVFSEFILPKAEVERSWHRFSTDLAWEIIEDKDGNIWFCTDGVGVVKYDGESFTHFTEKDGLNTNNVTAILEDRNGNIWFGSSEGRILEDETKSKFKYVDSNDGGLSMYDGNTFRQFKEEGLTGNDVWTIYEDRRGDIWIASKHNGAYRYDGKAFTNYRDELEIAYYNCAQSFLEAKDGKMWVGFSGGLFRLEENKLINVTKDGPWN